MRRAGAEPPLALAVAFALEIGRIVLSDVPAQASLAIAIGFWGGLAALAAMRHREAR